MRMTNLKRQRVLIAALSGLGFVAHARGQAVSNSTWLGAGGSGTWTDAANWDTAGNYPTGIGASATFPDNLGITANRTILLGSDVTVGSISIANNVPSGANLAASGKTNTIGVLNGTSPKITFQTNSGSASLTVTGINGTFNATPVNMFSPVILNSNLTVTTPVVTSTSTAGALTFRQQDISGTGSLIKNGPGFMTFADAPNKTYTGQTIINDGRWRLNGTATRPIGTSGVFINSTGQLTVSTGGTYTYGPSSSTVLTLNGLGPADQVAGNFPGAIRPDTNLIQTITNDIFLQSASMIHVQGATSGNTFLTGTVSGPGSMTFTALASNADLGKLTYAAASNTYTGGTIVNGGTLDSSFSTLGASTGPLQVNVIAFSGAQTTVLLNSSAPTTTGSLSGTLLNPANTATINNQGQDYTANQTTAGTYQGTITGAGGFGLGALSTATLTLTNVQTYTGATTVAAGRLSIANNLSTTSVNVTGGALELATGGGNNRVLKTPSMTTSGSGKIDIQDNKIITPMPVGTATGGIYTGVSRLIQTGRNGGGWGGTGIVTSQTQATTGNFTSIGVATASQAKGIAAGATTTFAGQTVTGSDTLVMYTYGGDANLDGKINVDDYTRIDFNVPLGVSGWYNGDFNYDGKINVDDYTIIDFNVGIQGAPFATAAGGGLGGVSAVPEPASLSIIGLGAAALLGRRRRRD